MAIRITTKPDVHVTQDELNRYRYDFDKEGQYYCGPRRDFEEYVRQRKEAEDVLNVADTLGLDVTSSHPKLSEDDKQSIKQKIRLSISNVHPGRHWI